MPPDEGRIMPHAHNSGLPRRMQGVLATEQRLNVKLKRLPLSWNEKNANNPCVLESFRIFMLILLYLCQAFMATLETRDQQRTEQRLNGPSVFGTASYTENSHVRT